MRVGNNAVVLIHYTLTRDNGEEIDSSAGGDPLAYLHGRGNLIRGLESQLEGKVAGDAVQARVAPQDAYGEVNPELVQNVARSAFSGIDTIEVGMRFQTPTTQGPRVAVVTEVSADTIRLDANHPLAGQHLNFAVEIMEVRAATMEELSHGHVHGPGGHHH
jgi:FKBP-type peptidyl-prolyl cis-trans isomerase SlyD